mgnify:CR=1 FL=1
MGIMLVRELQYRCKIILHRYIAVTTVSYPTIWRVYSYRLLTNHSNCEAGRKKEKTISYFLDLSERALAIGDVITYMALAMDNKEPEGQIARSEIYFIDPSNSASIAKNVCKNHNFPDLNDQIP